MSTFFGVSSFLPGSQGSSGLSECLCRVNRLLLQGANTTIMRVSSLPIFTCHYLPPLIICCSTIDVVTLPGPAFCCFDWASAPAEQTRAWALPSVMVWCPDVFSTGVGITSTCPEEQMGTEKKVGSRCKQASNNNNRIIVLLDAKQ